MWNGQLKIYSFRRLKLEGGLKYLASYNKEVCLNQFITLHASVDGSLCDITST